MNEKFDEYEREYLERLKNKEKGISVSKSSIESNDIENKKSGKGAHWSGKNVDLMKLTDKIVDWFYADGFAEVRKDVDNETFTVQARKAGKLRTLTSTRKVLTIVIKGTPNDFHVSVGTGEWGKGVAVAVVLTGVIGVVGLGFNAAFREKVWSNIKSIVSSLENSNSVSTSSISSKEDKPLDILKKRFALGEITKEEFEDMKQTMD